MNFYKHLEEAAFNENIEKLVVGAIIANPNDEVLLVKRRADDFMGGIFEIPGGNSEIGETIYDTLIREIKEETGLDIVGVECYVSHFDYLSRSCKKCRQFNFKVTTSFCENIFLTEHDEYKWATLDELENQKEVSPEVKHGLMIYVFNERQKNKVKL